MKPIILLKFLFAVLIMSSFQNDVHAEVILKRGKATVLRKTSDKTSCFPKKLENILLKISKNFGRPVHVVSGYRSPKDNERRGGAKNSQHIKCKAADFRVPGASTKRVGKFLARMKERGGAGFYCRGRFHVDVGTRRHWGGCVTSFINYEIEDSLSTETDRELNSTYNGEIIFTQDNDHDHEDENDYDEALFYNDYYEI